MDSHEVQSYVHISSMHKKRQTRSHMIRIAKFTCGCNNTSIANARTLWNLMCKSIRCNRTCTSMMDKKHRNALT